MTALYRCIGIHIHAYLFSHVAHKAALAVVGYFAVCRLHVEVDKQYDVITSP